MVEVLTRMEKSFLRRDVHFCSFERCSIYPHTIKFLYEKACKQVNGMGFQGIRRVSPMSANMILRIFWKTIEHSIPINLIGYDCYTLRYGEWVTLSSGGIKKIDFSSNHQKCWMAENRFFDGETEFFDYFLKVGLHK